MVAKKYIYLANYQIATLPKKIQKILSPYNFGTWAFEICVMGDLIREQQGFDFYDLDECIEFLEKWRDTHVESTIDRVPIPYEDGYTPVVQGFVAMTDEVRGAVLSILAKQKADEIDHKKEQLERAKKLLREAGEL